MYLSQAIEGFLLSRDGESKKDLYPTTINLYRNCLALLTDYLHDPELQRITNGDLVSYMNYHEKEYQPKRTVTIKLSGYARDNHWKAIRSFYVSIYRN